MSVHSDLPVAVIGAGPAGLVSARYLKKHGFNPFIFEASSEIGASFRAASARSSIGIGNASSKRSKLSVSPSALSSLTWQASVATTFFESSGAFDPSHAQPLAQAAMKADDLANPDELDNEADVDLAEAPAAYVGHAHGCSF